MEPASHVTIIWELITIKEDVEKLSVTEDKL